MSPTTRVALAVLWGIGTIVFFLGVASLFNPTDISWRDPLPPERASESACWYRLGRRILARLWRHFVVVSLICLLVIAVDWVV